MECLLSNIPAENEILQEKLNFIKINRRKSGGDQKKSGSFAYFTYGKNGTKRFETENLLKIDSFLEKYL